MTHKKYEANREKFADKLFGAYPELGQTADDVFAKIATYDPTSTQKDERHQYVFLGWVCSRLLKEKQREQDLYKVRENLDIYTRLVRLDKYRSSRQETTFYRPFVNPDIGQYSIATLSANILPYETQIKDRKKSEADLENEKAKAVNETIILYDGEEGRVVVPLTMEASQYWGKGTKWCISATKAENMFERYDHDGQSPILMFLPKGTREKFAANEHDKDVRDMLDDSLGGPLLKTDSRNKKQSIKILADFMAKVFSSGQLQIDKIQENENIVRAFHEMALLAPGIYHAILTKTPPQHLPDFFTIPSVIEYSKRYMDNDDSDSTHGSPILDIFYSQPELLIEIMTNPLFEGIKQKTLDSIQAENVEDAVLSRIKEMLRVPEGGISGTPHEVLQEFKTNHDCAIKINNDLEGHGHQFEMDIGDLALHYLTHVPKECWQDADFALEALRTISFVPSETLEKFPEAYQHHIVWQTALEETDGAFTDLLSFVNLYTASENVESLDYTPFVRMVEKLYPDGLETEKEVDIISTQMPKCDFTALLEKTIARHPEFFPDVAPEKQTMLMAIAAVKHDPESLADMAADLFKGHKRRPELTEAFNKLPPTSMVRAAVADYFTEQKLG